VEISVARKRLEEIRDDLDQTVAVLRGKHQAEHEKDAADAGANLTEADRNEAMLHSVTAQRTAVAAALDRIESGLYGQCVGCGQPVPEGRLEARPEAARCVNCQAKYDRKQR
jgi:DnaK suppressor protein